MANISENIRQLAREGLTTAEIAKRLDIRYQHAYKVLRDAGKLPLARAAIVDTETDIHVKIARPSKPPVTAKMLLDGGFVHTSKWLLSSTGELVLEQRLPKEVGVYAFAKEGIVCYMGVATMGLARRLYFYAKPGMSQRTSKRLNGILRRELLIVPHIDIYTAMPPDLQWNGLPIHGSAGLELGLIKKFALPWNMRSAG